MKFPRLLIAVVLAASPALASISPTLDVRQPLRNSTYVANQSEEVAGPRSVVKVFVPPGLAPDFLTDAQPLSRARLEGLNVDSTPISSIAISETIQKSQNYDNAHGTFVTLDFSSAVGLDAFFQDPQVSKVSLRVTTQDRDPLEDGVETPLIQGDETLDETLDADTDAPQLTSAYRDNDNVLYLVFSEPVSNGNDANSENQTNQQFVTAEDMQVNNAQNLFSAVTPTLSGAFTLISGYYDDAGRTILSYQLNSDTSGFVGDFIRLAADDFGNPTHNVFRDVAGNDAYQQGKPGVPTSVGVEILAGTPPGIGGSLFWIGDLFNTDFNAPTNWIPNTAPSFDKDAFLNITNFANITFSEPATVVRNLWIDSIVSMSVGGVNNPNAILYVTGQETFGGIFTQALLFRDAFSPEPSPKGAFSITQGIIDAESVGFRQDYDGFIVASFTNGAELRAGSVHIGDAKSNSSSMLLEAAEGGRLITGYDNEIGPRSLQTPSVIVDRSGSIGAGLDGEWISLGEVDVNAGGQLALADVGRAVFRAPVNINTDAFVYADDVIFTPDAPPTGNGAFFTDALNFQNNGLLISQRVSVEAGASIRPNELTIGLLGPESAGIAALDQLVAYSGSNVGADSFLTIAQGALVSLPDFDGTSPLPINETKTFIDINGGTLQIEFADGFDPPLGSDYPIISASNYSGQFANHVLPAFDDGRVAVIQYPIPGAGNGITLFGPRLFITNLESLLGFNPNPVVTPVDALPVNADTGDLDGDGDNDLAVVLAGDDQPGSIVILLNAGTVEGAWQGFERAVQIPTGPKPTAIAIGNYDNDPAGLGGSNLDLAVVCSGDDSLRLYLNAGAGQAFESLPPIPTGKFPVDVEAADFNADTHTDLAVVCKDDDIVQVFLNSFGAAALGGSGLFQAPNNVAAGDEPVDCDPVDLDNDKDLDIATGDLAGGVSTATNGGDGDFGPTTSTSTNNPVDAIATGDLNHDGATDTATVSRQSGLLSILINNKGSLLLFSTFAVGADASSLVISDYDNDGDNDISVVSIPAGDTLHRITVLRNDSQPDGPLVFTPSVELGGTTDPRVIFAVDVDGDGRPDVVTLDEQPGSSDGAVSSYINVSGPIPLCPGDANKDRRVDGKDLQTVLAMFGHPMPANTGPNVNGDTIVDGRDLSVILANYGTTCEIPTSAR